MSLSRSLLNGVGYRINEAIGYPPKASVSVTAVIDLIFRRRFLGYP